MRPITLNRRNPASMEGVHFTGSHGSMERSSDTDTTKSKSSLSLAGSEARDTFTDDIINPAKREPHWSDNNNSINFDTSKNIMATGRRSIGTMSDSGASFQTMITASETVVGSMLESPLYEEDVSVDVSAAGSALSREASVDPRRIPLSHDDEERFLKGEDPDFQPEFGTEFNTISWEQSPKGLSRQSSTRSELTAESYGQTSSGRQGNKRQLMGRQKSKRGRSFRNRGSSSRMRLGESDAVIKEGEEVTNEVAIGVASPLSDYLPDSSQSASEDSAARSSPLAFHASPLLGPTSSESERPQPEEQLLTEDTTKPSLKNSKSIAFVSRSASSFGSSDAPGLASSDVSLESTSPGVMSGRATLSSVPQMQSELSPVKEKKKSKSKKEKKSKKSKSKRHEDDSWQRTETLMDTSTERAEKLQSQSARRLERESSNRSNIRQDTPRSKKTPLSLTKKGETLRPSLHTLFEWSCDIQEEHGSRPRHRNHRSARSRGPQVRSRQMLRRASNEDGPRARSQSRESPRRLLCRSMSMPDLNQDIQQMTMTPKWPKRRFNNATFHQRFYEKDHDKVRVGAATARRRPRSEAPSVTPQQMLTIMEPCSMREVLAFNGFSDEFGPASNHVVNYADVLDNQSVFTASTGTSSAQPRKSKK